MASGLSARFGSNKLLAEFGNKKLIEIIIENTESLFGDNRFVLTRTQEVFELCQSREIPVLFHNLQNRNEAVKLGVERMKDCDACVFCASDQPLLQRDSIERLIKEFEKKGKGIYRLAFDNKVGNPILFTKEYYTELADLPEKRGGSYLAERYPKDVTLVEASSKWELVDVDRPDDLEFLKNIKENL